VSLPSFSLLQVFKYFDIKNRGYIQEEEFLSGLESLEISKHSDQFKKIFERFQTNN